MLGDLVRRNGGLARTLRPGRCSDGPADLWLAILDDHREPLAIGPAGPLSPTVQVTDGNVQLVFGPTVLQVVRPGKAATSWLVAVNAADATYQTVAPVDVALDDDGWLRPGDTVMLRALTLTLHP